MRLQHNLDTASFRAVRNVGIGVHRCGLQPGSFLFDSARRNAPAAGGVAEGKRGSHWMPMRHPAASLFREIGNLGAGGGSCDRLNAVVAGCL